MSKKHVFLQFFSKITLFACVFCVFFISPVFANLPAGYTELEYIESTGTQYIDTGVIGGWDVDVELDFMLSNTYSAFESMIGMGGGTSPYANILGLGAGNRFYSQVGGSSDYVYIATEDFNRHTYSFSQNGTTATCVFDNAAYTYSRNISQASVFSNVTLFKRSVATGATTKAKVYSLKVYKNTVMIVFFIPARRNSDGEVGMYDTVSGTFFTNSGTGDFIAGPIANCKTFGTDGVTCTECETDYILNNDGGCSEKIKIATTKYVDDEFVPLNTALANAISVVDNVVTQTIAQAGQIATLQNTKQTRPSDDNECPANMKCLLVTDESGTPHWYPIIEP